MGCSASSANKVEMLAASPFFLHLNEQQLHEFAQYFKVKSFPPNTKIFSEGDLGDEFFVIASGECDITALDSSGNEKFLCSKKAGDFFGEACLLRRTSPTEKVKRSATVTTTDVEGKCTMLVLSTKDFDKYINSIDENLRNIIKVMIGERMVDALKKMDFLHGIADSVLQLLANVFRYITVNEGDVIFEEGDIGRELYIISQGSVSVTAKGEDGNEVHFVDLEAGSYVGEIALLIDTPRTATVKAKQRCLLLCLGVEDFRNFLAIAPDLQVNFEKIVKERTADQFKKFKVPFFAQIPHERFKELSDLCVMERFDEGGVVFREGDVGDKFYLIVHGDLDVQKDGVSVGALKAGRYFGEIALVTDSPRTATIIAKSRVVLLSITKNNFALFFSSTPEAYADFAIKLSREKVPFKSVILHKSGHAYFKQHLASEYSTENIEFWDEANMYELLVDQNEREERANYLVTKYISEAAEFQVNIPSNCRSECIKNFKAQSSKYGQPPGPGVRADLFNSAREEIFKLMDKDSFKRFKTTPLFQKLLDEVGSYEDKPTPSAQNAGLAAAAASFSASTRQLNQGASSSSSASPTDVAVNVQH